MNIHFNTFLTDPKYKRLLYRRKFIKRILLLVFVFCASVYLTILLCGDMSTPRVLALTALDRCPACYGVSVCPELYSNQISLEAPTAWSIIFNAKNLYHGYTRVGRRVILKKLAHNSEFKEFDSNICKEWGLQYNCKPASLMNVTNVYDKIVNLVQYNLSTPDTSPRAGLVMCPYSYTVNDLLMTIFSQNNKVQQQVLLNIWTMLSINPEPIVLMTIPKSKGYPVPAYGGVCGRLELVANEGERLSSLLHVEWQRKLKYALGILNAALDFTYKHTRYRFYLMDWSLDNIVANKDDQITFVDLEDVIILDTHINPQKDLPDWYQRYNKEYIGPEFEFSIDNICKHHLSDHNLWAACFILAGPDTPLLYPIPDYINKYKPHLLKLLYKCLKEKDRFQTINKLITTIKDMLQDEKVIGYGGRTR